MLTIQPQKINQQNFKSSEIQRKNGITNSTCSQSNNLGQIDKALLALALIGMATLASCSKDEILDSWEDNQKTEQTANTVNNPYVPSISNTSKRCDMILGSLGLIVNENDSLGSIKTVYCKDSKGVDHYMKPTYVGYNCVKMSGMELYPDCTGGGEYDLTATKAGNGGINVDKIYKSGEVEKLNYILNEDGSVSELLRVGEGNGGTRGDFYVEKSVIRKTNDGVLERIYANGEKETYTHFSNEYDYPTPITFSATVDDWDNGGNYNTGN